MGPTSILHGPITISRGNLQKWAALEGDVLRSGLGLLFRAYCIVSQQYCHVFVAGDLLDNMKRDSR